MAWNYGTNTEVPPDPGQTLPAIDTTKIRWATQIQQKPFVDVREFGAKGDGVTDDSPAFQAAIDFAITRAWGRKVSIPYTASSYLLKTPIEITDDFLTIQGEGMPLIKCEGDGFHIPITGMNITFDNIALIGNEVTGQIGIHSIGGASMGVNKLRVSNCYFEQWGARGDVTAAAIKISKDSNGPMIYRNTFSCWGNGVMIVAPVDFLDISDNTFGQESGPTIVTGWGVYGKDWTGSANQQIRHNVFVTTGGAICLESGITQGEITDNEIEMLTGNGNITNAYSTAIYLGPSGGYLVRDNYVNLNNKGDYAYYVDPSVSGGRYENNKHINVLVSGWYFSPYGYGIFKDNINAAIAQTGDTYTTVGGVRAPRILDHSNDGTSHGHWGFGIEQPVAPFHINMPAAQPEAFPTPITDLTFDDNELVSPVTISDPARSVVLGFGIDPVYNAYIRCRKDTSGTYTSLPLATEAITIESLHAIDSNLTITETATQAGGAFVIKNSAGTIVATILKNGTGIRLLDTDAPQVSLQATTGEKFIAFATSGYVAMGAESNDTLIFLKNNVAVAQITTASGNKFQSLGGFVGGTGQFTVDNVGNVGAVKVTTQTASMTALPAYANNAAALGGGLTAGQLYRTGGDPDLVCVVH